MIMYYKGADIMEEKYIETQSKIRNEFVNELEDLCRKYEQKKTSENIIFELIHEITLICMKYVSMSIYDDPFFDNIAGMVQSKIKSKWGGKK